jgi:pantoate--beta-alanine ligase
MHEITGLESMRAWSRAEKKRGARVAFVPTMGALHEGHLRLVDRARGCADRVVMSIFVNPLQFGAGEDFDRYPRDLARDRGLAESRGVDLLFVPERSAMYGAPVEVRVNPGALGETLEGASRPGHFTGVLTVVAKLLHLVQPDIAVFGRKDVQQAVLVQRMVQDLNFPVEIDVHPTVREADGLALSSRNAYLHQHQRAAALSLSRALRTVEQAWRGGETNARSLERQGMDVLAANGASPEYLRLVDASLQPVERANARTIVVTAARVGATRLIDNVVLGEGVGTDPAVPPA